MTTADIVCGHSYHGNSMDINYRRKHTNVIAIPARVYVASLENSCSPSCVCVRVYVCMYVCMCMCGYINNSTHHHTILQVKKNI